MVVVLDYLFCLPVTSDAVYVLEGRLFAPVMRWADRTTLWSALQLRALQMLLFVCAGEVAVPGGDTARQDALNCASVKVCEGFRWQDKFIQPPEVEEAL